MSFNLLPSMKKLAIITIINDVTWQKLFYNKYYSIFDWIPFLKPLQVTTYRHQDSSASSILKTTFWLYRQSLKFGGLRVTKTKIHIPTKIKQVFEVRFYFGNNHDYNLFLNRLASCVSIQSSLSAIDKIILKFSFLCFCKWPLDRGLSYFPSRNFCVTCVALGS